MMIGSLPQQDVFQRVMSAKSEKIACYGPILGGSFYLLFAFVPMFIVIAATVGAPELASKLMADAPQEILPTFIKEYMPLWLRIMFFGAVLSAVMSTASATMLAPTTTFVENVLRNLMPLSDQRELKAMRISLVVFAIGVLTYALLMEGTPIYELAAMAYQFPVIGAFWPLTHRPLLETFDNSGLLAFYHRRLRCLDRSLVLRTRRRIPCTARRLPGCRTRTGHRISSPASC